MHSVRFLLIALSLAVFTADSAQAAPTLQNITVYIQNPTSRNIAFSYRKGGDDWYKATIKPGFTMTMRGIAPHQIRFDNGKGKVIAYSFRSNRTNFFKWSNGSLNLYHR